MGFYFQDMMSENLNKVIGQFSGHSLELQI